MLLSMLKGLRRSAAPRVAEPVTAPRTPAPQSRFADRLSLIVPSVTGRARFFDTALRHLATCAVRWPILVSDHSAEHESALSTVAARYPGLDVRLLRHPPAMHFLERLARCAEAAQTDYIVLHADDDFMMPAAMESCVAFLDANPDFAACKGRMAGFGIGNDGEIRVKKNDGRTRAENSAGARLIAHVTDFNPTLYAVHRRGVFVESCVRTLHFTRNVIFWQYMSSCIAVLRGKLQVLDEPYYLRLDNAVGWRAQLAGRRDPSHWPHLAVSPDFSSELARFRSGLLTLLDARDEEGDLAQQVDDACLSLIRRALCGGLKDPTDLDEAFLARLRTPGSDERALLEYCAGCVRRTEATVLERS